MKKRLFSMLLAIVMVVSMLSAMSLTASAAATNIVVNEATYYDNGALKSIDTSFSWGTASAPSRLVLMTKKLGSGDLTNNGQYGTDFLTFADAEAYDAANGTFGIVNDSNEKNLVSGTNTLTFEFEKSDIPLSQDKTYYIYLWTLWAQWGTPYYYPDYLIAVIKVQDGAVQYTEATGQNTYDENKFESVKAAVKYSVTVTPAANMTKTAESGAESQTELDVPMTDVVYTANAGYYFPDGYAVEAKNGIKVTRNSENQITVSGMPTADTEITLSAPEKKELELEEMTFLYAYDVQRSPTYPKVNDKITMTSLTYPLIAYSQKGTTNSGTWTLTKIGTYSIIDGSSKDSDVLQTIVDNIASNYTGMTAANVVIHELKDGDKHIAYGVTVAYDKDEEMAIFLGDTWQGSGAGYLLTTTAKSGTVSGTADTDVTDWVPPTTYDILVTGSQNGTTVTSISKTIAGDIVTVTVTPAEGQQCTGIEVKTASGADVPVTPVSRATTGNQWTFVMPAESVTVTASYEAKTPVYKVTYMADGTQVGEIQNVESGKDAVPPAVPEKTGYTGAWDKDGKNITADTVINAVYTVKTYTVTYKADGSTVGTPQTVEHGKDATAPAVPAKEGYNGAWDKDGKNITADTVINAVYTIKTYTVTYKADDKVVGNPQTVEHGKDATAPAVPEKTGYTGAWEKDGKNITADTVINAVYTIKTYTVTYKADGKVVDTQTVEHGGNAKPPKIPAKTGYSGKWSYEGKNVTADMTIEAVYSTNPFTGDNSNIYLMGALMLISLMAVLFLLVFGKNFFYRGKYLK